MLHPWLTKLSKINCEASATINALEQFRDYKSNILKQSIHQFIADRILSKSEKAGLDKVFRVFDKDGNGRISK